MITLVSTNKPQPEARSRWSRRLWRRHSPTCVYKMNHPRLTIFNSTGGKKILQRVAGKDASKQFWKYHNEGILKKYKGQLQIGSLDSKKAEAKPAAEPMPVAVPKKQAAPIAKKSHDEEAEALEPFGAGIPFSDPSWYQSVSLFLRGAHKARFPCGEC